MKFLIVLSCVLSVAVAVPYAANLAYAGHGYAGAYGAPLAYGGPVAVASPAGLGGVGFGLGGHFSPVPVQTVQYVGVPQPYAVAKPIPVDQPYSVPVDQPYSGMSLCFLSRAP